MKKIDRKMEKVNYHCCSYGFDNLSSGTMCKIGHCHLEKAVSFRRDAAKVTLFLRRKLKFSKYIVKLIKPLINNDVLLYVCGGLISIFKCL